MDRKRRVAAGKRGWGLKRKEGQMLGKNYEEKGRGWEEERLGSEEEGRAEAGKKQKEKGRGWEEERRI